MSGETTGQVLGASTAAVGGVALLPNTSGSMTTVVVIAIAAFSAIALGLVASSLYKKTR
jgi:hypothetical protein